MSKPIQSQLLSKWRHRLRTFRSKWPSEVRKVPFFTYNFVLFAQLLQPDSMQEKVHSRLGMLPFFKHVTKSLLECLAGSASTWTSSAVLVAIITRFPLHHFSTSCALRSKR